MEENPIETEIRIYASKRENLRKEMDKVNLHCSDLDDNLISLNAKLDNRLKKALDKEDKLHSIILEIEKRAKAIVESESKAEAEEIRLIKVRECVEKFVLEEKSMKSQICEMGLSLKKAGDDLEFKKLKLVEVEKETEKKRQDLLSVQDKIGVFQDKIEVANDDLERALSRARDLDVETERKKEDLERRREEVSVENETLCRIRSCVTDLEEKMEKKREDLSLVQEEIERRRAEMENLHREFKEEAERKKKDLDEIEAKKKHLELVNADLERRRGEASVEMELLHKNKARRCREIEEEIERKKKDLSLVSVKLNKKEKHLELVHVDTERRRGEFEEEMKTKTKDLTTVQEQLNELNLDLDLREELVNTLNTEMAETCQHIEERNAHHKSLEALIKQQEEEIVSKEKKQIEMAETLERSKALLQEVSERRSEEERSSESTRKELCSIKKAISECSQELKSKESLIEHDKVLEAKEKKLEEKEKEPKEIEKRLAKSVKSHKADALILCKALGVPSLPPVNNNNNAQSSLLNVNPEEPNFPQDALKYFEISASLSPNEVIAGLQTMEDPNRYILEEVNKALTEAHEQGETFLADPLLETFLNPLLVELPRVAKKPNERIKEEALKAAGLWKSMIEASISQISPLNAWGFLHLIVAYGLVSSMRQETALEFALCVAHFKYAPELIESLGLNNAIPSFVTKLLEEGRYIQLVRFILYFKLNYTLPAHVLLKVVINRLRIRAKEKTRLDLQREEKDAEKLKDIIELIQEFKLDINLPVDLILKFIVPREPLNQSVVPSLFPDQPPPLQVASNTGSSNKTLATFLGVPVYQQDVDSSAYQAQGPSYAGYKRPRVDPRPPSSSQVASNTGPNQTFATFPCLPVYQQGVGSSGSKLCRYSTTESGSSGS
ncbi:unnamed protein product [Cochlearia groenlandica]